MKKALLYSAMILAAVFSLSAVLPRGSVIPGYYVFSSAKREEIRSVLTLRATLKGGDTAIVAAGESGKLASLPSGKGSRVEKGDILFTVLTSDGNLHRETAPFSGYVSALFFSDGAILPEGAPVLSLTGTGNMTLSADAEEIYLSRLSEGQHVEVIFDAYPERSIKAEVEEILPYATVSGGAAAYFWNRGSTVVELSIRMENPPEGLIPGLSATAYVETERVPDAILVPSSALLADGKGAYVFTEKDARAVKRYVETGIVMDDYTQIVRGLAEGEAVVASPDDALREGMRVGHEE